MWADAVMKMCCKYVNANSDATYQIHCQKLSTSCLDHNLLHMDVRDNTSLSKHLST